MHANENAETVHILSRAIQHLVQELAEKGKGSPTSNATAGDGLNTLENAIIAMSSDLQGLTKAFVQLKQKIEQL